MKKTLSGTSKKHPSASLPTNSQSSRTSMYAPVARLLAPSIWALFRGSREFGIIRGALSLCCLFFCCFISSANAASYDPSLNWQTIKTKHFAVHYGNSLESQALKIAGYLEEANQKLTPKFDWQPWGRTEVILTDNNDSANGMTSTLPYNWMLLRLVAPDPDSVLADYDNWLRELVFHEYTHVLHLDQYGGVLTIPRFIFGKLVSPNGPVPGWIREGIATYIETTETERGRGQATYSDMMLRTAILNDEFLRIDEADGLSWSWPAYQSMYMYGVKFIQWLSDKYGEEKVMEFHKKVGRSPLLFAINHQARRVFNNVQIESKKVHNRYDRARKEGTPESQDFYDLWKEWKNELSKKYAQDKAHMEAEGLTKFENVAGGGTVLSNPATSKDGKFLAYARSRTKGPSELHLIDLSNGVNKVIKKRKLANAISFSPDSKKILFSAMGGFKTYNSFNDLYLYDIETDKTEQLTKGERASDAIFSADGKKIIFVKQDLGKSRLSVYDMDTKEISNLKFPATAGKQISAGIEQVANPSLSPDGRMVAFSGHNGKNWDLYVAEISNLKSLQVTNDAAIESHPVFSPDGRELYFVSDKTGISNIYVTHNSEPITQNSALPQRVTNVLTGVFQPTISQDGKTMFVQYYNGKGFDIRSFALDKEPLAARSASPFVFRNGHDELKVTADENAEGSFSGSSPSGKKYSSFGKSLFLPRFVIPTVGTYDDAIFAGAFTGGADPLRRHNWTGGVNYRTDFSSYVGYFFNYWYNRYKPAFSVGAMAYPVKFASISLLCQSVAPGNICVGPYSKDLFEKRTRGYGGVTIPFGLQAFGANYFFEDRDSNLTSGEIGFLNTYYPTVVPKLGHYAGFSFTYTYGRSERYPASISSEHGRKLRSTFTITNRRLGSATTMEQEVFAGDYREYISLPWARQVLALKTAGGITFGDQFNQGTFSLGGSLGGGSGGDSIYYFPIRGLPTATISRTRALLFSLEYRFPLFSLQRGLGTTPFYVKDVHFAPFFDYGNAWNASENTWGGGKHFFDEFFLSTGAEVRGDFVFGHGLPISGRVGYGIVIVNRDRILSSSKDPYFDTATKNGLFILQLGTSF